MSIKFTIFYGVMRCSLLPIYQTTRLKVPEDINILVCNIIIKKDNLLEILIPFQGKAVFRGKKRT
jgi:hypothetical protein